MGAILAFPQRPLAAAPTPPPPVATMILGPTTRTVIARSWGGRLAVVAWPEEFPDLTSRTE